MKNPLPQKGAGGLYHPTIQKQIIALVNKASHENLSLRRRDAAHSLDYQNIINK
ncbi:hypothetical protein ACFQZI_18250 [Mucilaginibacter lutimaris]|uniref:Uncharacterized protein n=1 Tax=Mucilaginibacter lutimaris TaxID=931629 RepID=A0ABW2ZKX6_9SPHI